MVQENWENYKVKKLGFFLHNNVPEEVPGLPPAHGKQRNELEYILEKITKIICKILAEQMSSSP